MGMAISIDVRDAVTADAIDEVVAWFHHVNDTFSTHRVDTPVSRLGLGELTLDDMPDEVLDVLCRCEELHDDTEGWFDVLSVRAPNGSRLDPSGLVKGWSIERAAAILEAHGAQRFCINGGGDIVVRGEPSPGEPWRIGIRHPDDKLLSAAPRRGVGAARDRHVRFVRARRAHHRPHHRRADGRPRERHDRRHRPRRCRRVCHHRVRPGPRRHHLADGAPTRTTPRS
jgi:thiamine biosynthesis lipoprotein ApbE